MNKSTKLKNALKPLITALSAMALCCSAMSYAGDDKAENSSVPSKPYFYTGANEDEVIRFDRSILQNSRHFAFNLALKAFSPEIYRVLQDTKTYLFQQNQIALMQDLLAELKAINTNLTDRSAIPTPAKLHQTLKEKMNEIQIHKSGDVVRLVGDVKCDSLAIFQAAVEASCSLEQPEDNDRDNILRWPVGIVTPKSTALGKVKTPKSIVGEAIADYYTAQLAKQNAVFAKHGITELPMKPKTNTVDLSKIEMPRITSSNSGIDFVLPENFKLISSDELIALAQEIFNRKSFQDEVAALIEQEIAKATPLSTQQSTDKEQSNA